MAWINYMIMAAEHSKGSARHWFRYLRKHVDDYGGLFTKDDIDALCASGKLSLFQQVSIRATFTDGSPTRQYVLSLNEPAKFTMLDTVKAKLQEGRI